MKVAKGNRTDKKYFYETVLVIMVTIILFITLNEYSSILTAIPAVYLILERRFRKRSWSDIGFKFKNTMMNIGKVWHWVVLVTFASPIITLIIANLMLPEFIVHVKGRLPMDTSLIIATIITITIGTFLEEIIFRGFIQERLGWFIAGPIAIIISSILFAFMHYSSGDFNIVIFDIITIFIDSILYGIIYAKTKNIFTSWVAHYLCDIVAIICIWMFF